MMHDISKRDTPFFSLVIPTYNSEKFIEKTLNHILDQIFPNFELICVDDGSTDKTLEILKNFACKDKRINLYPVEHHGAGYARNHGLTKIAGEYVLLLDSDDFFEKHMLSALHQHLIEEDLDMLVFRSDQFDILDHKFSAMDWTVKKELLPEKKIFTWRDVPEDKLSVFHWWAWDKVYKTNFLRENNLEHQEILSTNDLYFNLTAYLKAKKISFIDDILLHHTVNISTSIVNTRNEHFENCLFALYWVYKFLNENKLYDKLENDFINYSIHFFTWHLKTLPKEISTRLAIIYKKRYTQYFDFSLYTNNIFIKQRELKNLLKILNAR